MKYTIKNVNILDYLIYIYIYIYIYKYILFYVFNLIYIINASDNYVQ